MILEEKNNQDFASKPLQHVCTLQQVATTAISMSYMFTKSEYDSQVAALFCEALKTQMLGSFKVQIGPNLILPWNTPFLKVPVLTLLTAKEEILEVIMGMGGTYIKMLI